MSALIHGIAWRGWLLPIHLTAVLRRMGVATTSIDWRWHGRGGSALVRTLLRSTESRIAGIGILV